MKRGFGILVLAIFVLSICILAGPLRAVAVEGASGQSAVVSNAPISLQTNAVSSSQSVEGAVNPEQASSNQGGTLEEETTVPEEDNQSSQPLVSAQLPENEANKAPISKSPAKASAQSAFHASIPFNKDTYSAGSTAICTVKYDIDRGAINEGDTIAVTIPTDIASKVSFSVDPLHFKSVSDKGNGVWELTLGSNAQTALTGSFSMYITTADVAQETTEPVTVGNASKTFTVVPTGQPGGVGQATDVINKDAPDDKVSFGDYDYSEGYGDNAAQIGIFDSSSDQTIGYRLIVNDKRISMDNISVTDTLPDGMIFDRTHPVKVVDSNGGVVDSSLYSVSMSGQTMVFSYPGTLADPVWVYYWVNTKAAASVKYTNHAELSYTADGSTHVAHRNYVLQSASYNAACGEKSVDKTVVTTDPSDQKVTYTIKLWNSNGFAAGEINLDDVLDSHVKFLYADPNPSFDMSYDEASHTVHIQNSAAISGNDTEYVRFVVDFSDVPEGYTVENTVGGNTTKTMKTPTVTLGAVKTVDGKAPSDSQVFTFQLLDHEGNVLQEKQNNGSSVSFDSIAYTPDDLAADGGDTVVHYTVKEKPGSDSSMTYDTTVYDVAVTLHRETGADGSTVMTAVPSFSKNGASVVDDLQQYDHAAR